MVTASLLKLAIRYPLPFSITVLNVAMEHAVELNYQLKLVLALVLEANRGNNFAIVKLNV